MTRNERIFRIIAVTSLGLGIIAIVRYEVLIFKLTEVVNGIEQLKFDTEFDGIVNRLEDGEQ